MPQPVRKRVPSGATTPQRRSSASEEESSVHQTEFTIEHAKNRNRLLLAVGLTLLASTLYRPLLYWRDFVRWAQHGSTPYQRANVRRVPAPAEPIDLFDSSVYFTHASVSALLGNISSDLASGAVTKDNFLGHMVLAEAAQVDASPAACARCIALGQAEPEHAVMRGWMRRSLAAAVATELSDAKLAKAAAAFLDALPLNATTCAAPHPSHAPRVLARWPGRQLPYDAHSTALPTRRAFHS